MAMVCSCPWWNNTGTFWVSFTVLGCLSQVSSIKISNNEPILYKLASTFTSGKIIGLLRTVDMATHEPRRGTVLHHKT